MGDIKKDYMTAFRGLRAASGLRGLSFHEDLACDKPRPKLKQPYLSHFRTLLEEATMLADGRVIDPTYLYPQSKFFAHMEATK